MAVQRRGGGGYPPWTPRLQTKVTIAGKNEIYRWENLIGPFLVHKLLGPSPSPSPPPSEYFPASAPRGCSRDPPEA